MGQPGAWLKCRERAVTKTFKKQLTRQQVCQMYTYISIKNIIIS